jgi:hypothetical protein
MEYGVLADAYTCWVWANEAIFSAQEDYIIGKCLAPAENVKIEVYSD